jgi:hypothetical protein
VTRTARRSPCSTTATICGEAGEASQQLARSVRGAHDGEPLARVAPAPDVAGGRTAERRGDPADQIARAVQEESVPRPRSRHLPPGRLGRGHSAQRLPEPRLGLRPHPEHFAQAPGRDGLAELVGGAHAERPRGLDRPLRPESEVAAQADQVRRHLALELGELGDPARLDELAEPAIDARSDPAQLPRPPVADELGHGSAAARIVSAAWR